MEIIQAPLQDSFILTPKFFEDERGVFYESFNQKIFSDLTGLNPNWVQDNQSISSYGVLRGLHFQQGEMAQAKLVRVVMGRVLDVIVDLRPNSSTFGKQFSLELSEENSKQLFVPRGFAHGFITLSKKSIFLYKSDNFYSKAHEGGIIYNDATLNINWHLPENNFIVSEKDKKLPSFKEVIK